MSTRTSVVRRSRRNAVVAAVTAIAAAGALAACGSSSSNSTSGSSTTGSKNVTAALSQAEQVLNQGATRPTDITVGTPIAKPIPTGKKLVFISCGAASCQLQGNIVKEAASQGRRKPRPRRAERSEVPVSRITRPAIRKAARFMNR